MSLFSHILVKLLRNELFNEDMSLLLNSSSPIVPWKWPKKSKNGGLCVSTGIVSKGIAVPFATAWMELESIMLSEISQLVKDK